MNLEFHAVALAFGLTLLAGLATGIGSCIAFLSRQTNTRFLSLALGFSAGVMLYVSFVEILAKARASLAGPWGDTTAAWATAAAFFGGIAFIALIDKLVPNHENPHEVRFVEDLQTSMELSERAALLPATAQAGASFREPGTSGPAAAVTDAGIGKSADRAAKDDTTERRHMTGGLDPESRDKLRRTGIFTAIAIAIHNFPEGLATFTIALSEPATGIAITVAIAIHNIPEGIAVSVPLYYATGSRKKAFAYSFLSGLAEPAGAVVGFLLLLPFFSPAIFGLLFAGVAGIMVFISLDELLPAAEKYGEHHLCVYGLVSGMAVMALSLLLFL